MTKESTAELRGEFLTIDLIDDDDERRMFGLNATK